jgi:hypothetical protein
MCRPSGTRGLFLTTGDFRPRLQVISSLPTPISAKAALFGDPGFATGAFGRLVLICFFLYPTVLIYFFLYPTVRARQRPSPPARFHAWAKLLPRLRRWNGRHCGSPGRPFV